jgi:hypothetical protein
MVGWTGIEPVTSGVSNQRYFLLSYQPTKTVEQDGFEPTPPGTMPVLFQLSYCPIGLTRPSRNTGNVAT